MSNSLSAANSLKDYIAVIYQMEQMKFQQEKAIEKLEENIRRLSNVQPLPCPAKPPAVERGGCSMLWLIPGVAFAIFALQVFSGGLHYLLGGVLFMLIAFKLLGNAEECHTKNKAAEESDKRAAESYKRNLQEYEKSKLAVKTKKQMANILKDKLNDMNARLYKMEQILNRAYSCNIIHPRYRNLVAVSSFNDYLEQGRCNTLEGFEGAYNIYNFEERLDKIITRLDDIYRSLEQIRYSQNTLYHTLKESNQQMERMQNSFESSAKQLETMIEKQSSVAISQLQKRADNAELTRFNTQQARKELELRNRMDGIFNVYNS